MSAKAGADRRWLLYALGALFFFGVTNFSLGFISEKSAGDPAASIKAAMILWLGTGLLGIAGSSWFFFSGRGFSGLPRRNSAFLPLAAGITLALGMLLLKLSLAANVLAKGPIVAIASSNSLVVALLAWVFLREKLSPGQLGSFLVIIAGITLLSLGGMAGDELDAVGYAVASMLLLGLTNFFLKLAGEQGFDSITAAVLLWLAVGGCGVLAVAWHWLERARWPWLEPGGLVWLTLLAGIFLALGMLLVKKSVTLGPAGPATAVSGSNAILVSLLDLVLLGHWLAPLKLAGMLAAVAGIVALALARPLNKGRAGRVDALE
jgi:drug/metabolite transporter (DMT)-like permease